MFNERLTIRRYCVLRIPYDGFTHYATRNTQEGYDG